MKHYTRILSGIMLLCGTLFAPKGWTQVSVTATAGTAGPTSYTTLKAAFDAVNAGTHQGTVTISLTGNTTETATATLNASGSGSASYTGVTVKPGTGATPTVSGSIAGTTLIALNGASNVTIDGSNSGGTTRDLTITNTSATSGSVLQIGSVGTTAITNVTVKNTVITNGTTSSSAIVAGDAATAGNPGVLGTITIQNNKVQKAYNGMYLRCTATAVSTITITGNDLNATGTSAIRLAGISLQSINGATVTNNNIGNFSSTDGEYDAGINIGSGSKNITISGNNISPLAYTGSSSYAPTGILVAAATTGANIAITNNNISNITSSGQDYVSGIDLLGSTSGLTISSNKISNIRNTNSLGYGAAGIALESSATNAATKVYNNFIWDVAGYGYTGYALADNGNGIVVEDGGGYDIDFNTVVLNSEQTAATHRASCLLITEDVFTTSSINVRNNIFTNLQTVGGVNTRYAIANLAGNAVFNTIDRNDYYCTSGKLSSKGTTATITSTLAALQTSIGGNANSVNILPVFVGTNDLHLSTAANSTLNNLGTPVTGITTDIDNDVRSATTPDMGADEFTPCLTISFTTQPSAAVICAGADTGFTVVATNGNNYQWQVNTGSGFNDISNNSIYSGATTASLHLTQPPASYSTYSYRCQVTSQTGCAATASSAVTLTINARPTATITPASSTSLCTGGSVVLNAPAGFNYQWLLNSGPITPPATGGSYTAGTAGSYKVVVTQSTTGCKDTSAAVNVIINTPVTATQNVSVCASQLPYPWNGHIVPAAGTAVATHTQPSLVTGCDSTTTLNLTVNATIQADLNVTTCANQLPYTWHGQSISTGGTAVATFTTTGSGGCDSVTRLNLTVKPIVQATQTVNICHTQLPYPWNGQNVAAGGSAAATFTTTSLVTGCDSVTTLNLVVNPGPVATASPVSPAICSGATTAITLSSSTTGATFAWTASATGATGSSSGSGASIAQSLTASGNTAGKVVYTITATASSCAGAPITDTVTVNPKPVATATPSTQTICTGTPTSIALTSTVSGATYTWTVSQTNASGATASSGALIAQTLTATGSGSGTATYTITPAANGCSGSAITATATVSQVPAAAGAITGADAPCAGSTQTYSIASVTGATSYNWILPPGWTGTSTTNSITITVGTANGNISVAAGNTCGSSAASTKAVTATPVVTPAVTISSNAPALLCSGNPVTFTATISNGGAIPTYQWRVNSNNVGSNSNTYMYTPQDGDTITCKLTSNAPCVTANGIVSNKIILQVTPSVYPTLNIYVPENNVCSGIPVTFLATGTQGGSAPVYQWKVNNSNVGTNSVNYTYTPTHGDMVTCEMTSNAVCATPTKLTSNMVPMSVTQVIHPAVSLTSSATEIPKGQPVTFTAQVTQAGPGAQVTWYKNGVYITSATGNTWTGVAGTDFTHNSRIQVLLRSFSPCAEPDTVWSNTIKMSVGATGIGNNPLPDGFKLYPNPTYNAVQIEGLSAGDQLSVYDVLGHRLQQHEVRQNGIYKLDMSALSQGMYWLHFSNRKGQQWQVKVTRQ